MRSKIKKHYAGFVPMYVSHPTSLCAFYHCAKERIEARRYCQEHSSLYDFDAKTLPADKKILCFTLPEIT